MFRRETFPFFSTHMQTLNNYLFDAIYYYNKIIDYLYYAYENSPINIRTITGIHHPRIPGYHSHPLLGALNKMRNDGQDGIANVFAELAKLALDSEKNPRGMVYCSIGPLPSTLITRPHEIAQLVYNEDKISRVIPAFHEIFGHHNLLSLPQNDEWRRKRTELIESILSERSLETLVEPMQHIIDEFIEKLKKNGNIESLETFLVSLTLEVIARTRLGSGSLGDNATRRISEGLGKAIDASSMPMRNLMVKLISISDYARRVYQPVIQEDRENLRRTITDNFFVTQVEAIRKTDNLLRKYFDKSPHDDQLAFSEAMEDASLYLLAGHETTERLLQFCMMVLYKHPFIIEKLREEIQANQPADNCWTKKDIDKMTYLGKVLKETLRLYSPIPIITRTVKKRFILADIPVCKNREEYKREMDKRDVTKDIIFHPRETINVMPYYTHRRQDLYFNPLHFNPERFNSEDINMRLEMQNDQDDLFYFIPFGFGSRNCPGRRFAFQEAKIFLIRALQTFTFRVFPDNFETCIRGTLKFKTPISAVFEPLPREEKESKENSKKESPGSLSISIRPTTGRASCIGHFGSHTRQSEKNSIDIKPVIRTIKSF